MTTKTIRRSAPREPSGLRTTRLRAAALCVSLAGTTRTPVPGLAASAPVAQQLRLLALLSAWRTLAWTPPRKQECKKGEIRVSYGKGSKCMPECKSGEYSRTGAVPCRNCPKGYVTDGSGATTCVKDSGSSSEEDKKKDCPKGTKYVTEDKYGSGCPPRVPPRLVQLHRPVSLHALQKWRVHQGESATECTDYPTGALQALS